MTVLIFSTLNTFVSLHSLENSAKGQLNKYSYRESELVREQLSVQTDRYLMEQR